MILPRQRAPFHHHVLARQRTRVHRRARQYVRAHARYRLLTHARRLGLTPVCKTVTTEYWSHHLTVTRWLLALQSSLM